jgi:hypothetical protein
MDIKAHGGDVRAIVRIVRDWLFTVSRRQKLPSPDLVLRSYDGFVTALPSLAKEMGLDEGNLIFPDYERLVVAWTKQGDS